MHGSTEEDARRVDLELVKGKDEEAYRRYEIGELVLLEHDKYSFTKRTQGERLQGNVDAMMSWLRIVEVAINAKERKRVQSAQQAARFFQPFRDLGKRKKEAKELLFLQEKVDDAYKRYREGTLNLLERDKFLFKRSKEVLLTNEADASAPRTLHNILLQDA